MLRMSPECLIRVVEGKEASGTPSPGLSPGGLPTGLLT